MVAHEEAVLFAISVLTESSPQLIDGGEDSVRGLQMTIKDLSQFQRKSAHAPQKELPKRKL